MYEKWPFVNPISVCVYPTAIQLSMVIDSPTASGLCVVDGDAGCTDEASSFTYAMLSQPPASAEYVTGVGGTDGSPRQIWPGVHHSPPLNKRFLVLFFALRVHTGEPSSPLGPYDPPPSLPQTNAANQPCVCPYLFTSLRYSPVYSAFNPNYSSMRGGYSTSTNIRRWAGNLQWSFSSFWSHSSSLQPIRITQHY